MENNDQDNGVVMGEWLGAKPPQIGPLNVSRATPDLFAALAKAQAAVETVGKDGRNRDKGYGYATADSMIRGGRAARVGTGLSLLSSWTFVEIEPPSDTERGQWPGALVTLHYVLAHEGGGMISGSLAMHAICSRGRPIDKAVASAATYAEGFVERNLMRLDRQEESSDDVERRPDRDTDTAPARPRQPEVKRPSADEVVGAFNTATDEAGYRAARASMELAWPALNGEGRDYAKAAQKACADRLRNGSNGKAQAEPGAQDQADPANQAAANGGQ